MIENIFKDIRHALRVLGKSPGLFGVSATDTMAFAVVTLLLVVIASIASLIPAYRAAKTDPVVVLRQ